MTDTQIVWLRRDLRLADNPALYHAAQQGPVVAVFVLDDEVAKTHTYGGASRWWLHHSLADLGRRIEERGSRLILRRGDSIEHLAAIAEETGAKTIHANRHYEPWWRNAEKALGERIDLQRYDDANFLTVMGSIQTGSGGQLEVAGISGVVSTRFTPPSAAPCARNSLRGANCRSPKRCLHRMPGLLPTI